MELPAEREMRWILRHAAALVALGAEPVRGLVLPNAEFFPDRFDGSPPSVGALFSRVMDHAGLGHVKVELAVVAPKEQQPSSCSSGACGGTGEIDTRTPRVSRALEGGYRVMVPAGELAHPVVLTTGLVRAASFVFLCEADAYTEFDRRDRELVTDLAAVLLGFGVLVANGAHVYMKGCGGAKVHAATSLPVSEAALALAMFCAMFGADAATAERHLDPTQRDLFGEAVAWTRSNAGTVALVRSNKAAIDADVYRLAPARGWLSRAFGIGAKKKRGEGDAFDEMERALLEAAPKSGPRRIDAAKRQKLEELRALVDESLD